MENSLPVLTPVGPIISNRPVDVLIPGDILKWLLFLEYQNGTDNEVYRLKISQVLQGGTYNGVLSGSPWKSPHNVKIKQSTDPMRYELYLILASGEMVKYAELAVISKTSTAYEPIYWQDFSRPLPKKEYRIGFSDNDLGVPEMTQVNNIEWVKNTISYTRRMSSAIINYWQDQEGNIWRLILVKDVLKWTRISWYILSDKVPKRLKVDYVVQRISRSGIFVTLVQDGTPKEKKDNRVYLLNTIDNISDAYQLARLSIPETGQNVGILRFSFLPH